MKGFREQFIECSKEKLVGEGLLEKFKDHPEYLPHPLLHPKFAKNLKKRLDKNPDEGVRFSTCLRFNNGRCSSGNEKCRELRREEK